MKVSLTNKNNEKRIRIDFNYDPNTIAKIKKIKGWSYYGDSIDNFWHIPITSLQSAKEILGITEGHLFSEAKELIDKNKFSVVSGELKHDRIKISSNNPEIANYFIKTISDLCSYYNTTVETEKDSEEEEETFDANDYKYKKRKNFYKTEQISLSELVYCKNNVLVLTFAKGFYWRVKEYCEFFNLENLTVYPYPDYPQPCLELGFHIEPRDYQLKAAEITDNQNRATLVMATGGGKTITSAIITHKLKVNTLFLVYSNDLLKQTVEEYEKAFNQPMGIIGDDNFDIQPITIASVPMIRSIVEHKDERWEPLMSFFETVDLLFIDEGHMLGAETILNTSLMVDAFFTYSLTATPYREDGKQICIEAGSGPDVEIISEEELIRKKRILPIKVNMVKIEHKATKKKTYNSIYKHCVIDNMQRNLSVVEIANYYLQHSKSVLILVKDIKYGQGDLLAEALNCQFIHGKTKPAIRKEALEDFKSGDSRVLVASSILKQGIDLPIAEVLILAHSGKSFVELLQKIGRIRRPDPNNTNKKYGIVVDFYDYIVDIKPNTKDILRQQAEKRLAIYKDRNFDVKFANFKKESQAPAKNSEVKLVHHKG